MKARITGLGLLVSGAKEILQFWKVAFIVLICFSPLQGARLSIHNGQHVMQDGEEYNTIEVFGNAHLDITGGILERYMWLSHDATVNIYGGNLFTEDIVGITPFLVELESHAFIYGSDFAINGHPVSGLLDLDFLTDNGHLTFVSGSETNDWSGHLTGILQDGNELSVDFTISRFNSNNNANITLIPEPLSLSLIGMGGLLVLRRASKQ